MDQAEYVKLCRDEGIDTWNSIMLLYNAAIKEMATKVEILNDEFQHTHQYNPIEYVKSRVKRPESIIKKLKNYGYEESIENMVNYCNDIAGFRIVCSFTSDIYRMADMIGGQNDITVISIKDYITSEGKSVGNARWSLDGGHIFFTQGGQIWKAAFKGEGGKPALGEKVKLSDVEGGVGE